MADKSEIVFKKIKKKSVRQPVHIEDTDSENDDNEIELKTCLEETKIIRKLRQKHGGLSAEELMTGKNKSKKTLDSDRQISVGVSGMIDLEKLKNVSTTDDVLETGIGTSFSAETNRRDEDAEMQKFIEENLAVRKGVMKGEYDLTNSEKYSTPEEAALMSLPSYLKKSTSHKNEEMLSNQMLNGIPEVDLGLDVKIKNIEQTEEAKQKLIKESLMKKEKPSEFVPNNMAVNFVQHNRFNLDEAGKEKKKKEKNVEIVEPVVGGIKISKVTGKRPNIDQASDDDHYEKFKKKFIKRH